MRREKSDYLIKSVGFALDILEQFNAKDGTLNSARLVRNLEMDKKSAGKLLATLEERRYLSKNRRTGHYHLGEKVLALRSTFIKSLDVKRAATPVLERLAAFSGETCFLAKPKQDFMVYGEVLESDQTVRVALNRGDREALETSAAGKALLAFSGRTTRKNMLGKIAPGSALSRLKKQLDHISAQGYACEYEEQHQDMGSVAAPVFNHAGAAVAAVGLMAPLTRFGRERLLELIPPLLRGADDISRGLGFAQNAR